MQVYIDANVYLEYFRENAGERLAPLKALDRLVKQKKITLLLPTQTKQEYFRNRRKIAEATRVALVKQSRASSLIPAVMDTGTKEVKSVLKESKKLSQSYKKLIEKYDADVEKERTDADVLLKSLFKQALPLPESEEILQRAHQRYLKGNPPRKSDHSYGDAVTWEILLESATSGDLVIITRDGDYMEVKKGERTLNSYLYAEWRIRTKKKKKLTLFKSLAEFVNIFEKKKTIKEEIVKKEKEEEYTGGLTLASFPQSSILGSQNVVSMPLSEIRTITGSAVYPETWGQLLNGGVTIVPGTTAASFCPYCGQKATSQLLGGGYVCSNPQCRRHFNL